MLTVGGLLLSAALGAQPSAPGAVRASGADQIESTREEPSGPALLEPFDPSVPAVALRPAAEADSRDLRDPFVDRWPVALARSDQAMEQGRAPLPDPFDPRVRTSPRPGPPPTVAPPPHPAPPTSPAAIGPAARAREPEIRDPFAG